MARSLIALILILVAGGSASAGGAKTVHVKAYTKKDGTFVAEHWRSPPGGGKATPPPAPVVPVIPDPPAPRTQPRVTVPRGPATTARTTPPPAEQRYTPPPVEPPAVTVVVINGFRAEIEGVRVGRTLFGSRSPDSSYLIVRLKLESYGPLPFRSWGRGSPKLIDSKGRTLAHIGKDDRGNTPSGQYEGNGVRAGGLRDVVVFEQPAPDAGDLLLELPADFADPGDAFYFVIPASAWRG